MKKITQTLLLLMFSYASMCAQVTVKSTKVTVEEAKTAELNNRFEEYEVIEIDLSQFKRNITSLEETRVLWTFGEQTKYDMRIYPKDIRSSSYQAALVSTKGISIQEKSVAANTYKGYLSNGNTVRLTVDDDFIYGGIQTEEGFVMIKQLKYILKDESISPNNLVLYKSDKVKEDDGYCATPDEPSKSGQTESTITRSSSSSGCHIVEVALDCDTEYWNLYNTNSINMMLGEMNMIQDVYEDEVNAILSVTSVNIFIGGMYTSINGSTIISEIQSLWSSPTYSGIPRDLVHHFTGKNTGPFGQASRIGGACDDPNPVCWTEDRANANQTMAHEIGHLLNGRHSEGTNCGTPFVRSIMCQGDNKQLSFSAGSITSLTNFMNNRNCFNFNTVLIVGNSGMCVNDTRTYYLYNFEGTANTDIIWSVNSSLSIVSGQGTESVVVRGSFNGEGVLTATLDYPGSCGMVTETKNIDVGPPIMDLTVSGPDSYGYVYATVTGGTAPYLWTIWANSTITQTTYAPYILVYVGSTSGILEVESSNSCGTGYASDGFYSTFSGGYNFLVYPNPASNEINVKKSTEFETYKDSSPVFYGIITLSLYNLSGLMVRSEKLDGSREALKMKVEDLPEGNYFLKVSGKNIEEVHQVRVE